LSEFPPDFFLTLIFINKIPRVRVEVRRPRTPEYKIRIVKVEVHVDCYVAGSGHQGDKIQKWENDARLDGHGGATID